MSAPSTPVTILLRRWREGDSDARDELIPLVYENLSSLAARSMSHESPGHTLRPTALVHEAYLRMAAGGVPWNDRLHFFAVASRVMRRVLIDHAKARSAGKRGGGAEAIALDDHLASRTTDPVDLLALDAALTRLAAFDARKAELVEMVYFGGMTLEECGHALQLSTATAQRDLASARAWLLKQLNPQR
jgi:RNA polymerase sigma factor (TIGR02999 family)